MAQTLWHPQNFSFSRWQLFFIWSPFSEIHLATLSYSHNYHFPYISSIIWHLNGVQIDCGSKYLYSLGWFLSLWVITHPIFSLTWSHLQGCSRLHLYWTPGSTPEEKKSIPFAIIPANVFIFISNTKYYKEKKSSPCIQVLSPAHDSVPPWFCKTPENFPSSKFTRGRLWKSLWDFEIFCKFWT